MCRVCVFISYVFFIFILFQEWEIHRWLCTYVSCVCLCFGAKIKTTLLEYIMCRSSDFCIYKNISLIYECVVHKKTKIINKEEPKKLVFFQFIYICLFVDFGGIYDTHSNVCLDTLKYSHVPSKARPRTRELIRRVIADIEIKKKINSVSFYFISFLFFSF